MVDTAKLPNFDALEEWIGKLRDWCEEAVDRTARLQMEVDDLEDEVKDRDEEMVDYRDSIIEMFKDVERGILTLEEFALRLKPVVR